MAKFFFSIRDSEKFQEDHHQGVVLPDLGAAIDEARLAIREMLAEMVLNGEPIDGQVFQITDNIGFVTATVPWRSELHPDD